MLSRFQRFMIGIVLLIGLAFFATQSPAHADGSCRISGAHSPETIVDEVGRHAPQKPDDVTVHTGAEVKIILKLIGWGKKPTGFEVERIGFIKWSDGSAIMYLERGDTCVIKYYVVSKDGMEAIAKALATTKA